jgi:virginiamycin B lyase
VVVWAATIVTLGTAGMAAPAGAQRVTEFPIPTASDALGIAAGPDGALWFTEDNCVFGLDAVDCRSSEIGRITTEGTITEFPLVAADSRPSEIVAGPDGAMWFITLGLRGACCTHVGGNTIGRITTEGAIKELPNPTANNILAGIAAGPDGALWFTEPPYSLPTVAKIGRITPGGTITEFPLPPRSYPTAITAGPDAALWFINSRKIGRITTSGTVTEFPLRTATGGSESIAAGPDGALWFTGIGNRIGRITTSGAVTEFPLRGADSRPLGIAAGPDGALWFTEALTDARAGRIGRITTKGVVSEFPLRGAESSPGRIAAGPDGAMWFTNRQRRPFEDFFRSEDPTIGRITVPPGPRVSLKVSPRTGCASSKVVVKVKVKGEEKLRVVKLSLDGRRVVRTSRRSFRVKLTVRRLGSGTHTLKATARDKAGGRAAKSRRFRRC